MSDDQQDITDDQSAALDRMLDEHLGEQGGGGQGPSVATQLVKAARERYDLGQTPDGEVFAMLRDGAPIVRTLRGGRHSLRAELARDFYDSTGMVASQSALADAVSVLEGYAGTLDPTELHLRVAEHGGAQVIDLGDATGRAVVVGADGWDVVARPPVLFKRTALTGVLPEPERYGSLDDLWSLLNVAVDHRPILAAVLVSALMPAIPHPITALTGEQGTGKTTAAKMIAAALDPSPAQVRKAPRDVEQWTTAAAGSWVVALDNLSGIGEQLSDALCRASTGDGDVRRRLYSDGDLSVIAFRRVVLLTGIDLGDLADDLVDRLVMIGLERIGDADRRLDAELTAAWEQAHPRVLGALLDLTARVLAVLPTIRLAESPRMADFGRVLAAVDQVLGSTGLKTYLGLREELAGDAMSTDPVLAAIASTVRTEVTWTAAQLLAALDEKLKEDERRPPKEWPTTARAMTSKLTRSAPAMRRVGWTVADAGKHGDARAKRWHLVPPPSGGGQQREPGNDARDARDARSADETAGQDGSGGPSVDPSVDPSTPERRSGGPSVPSVADDLDSRRSVRRSVDGEPVTSENDADPSVPSAPSVDPTLPLPTGSDTWRKSGKAVRSA